MKETPARVRAWAVFCLVTMPVALPVVSLAWHWRKIRATYADNYKAAWHALKTGTM